MLFLRLSIVCLMLALGITGIATTNVAKAQETLTAEAKAKRLNQLFAELQRATRAEEASRPVEEIWNTWLQSGDPEIDRDMRNAITAMNRQRYSLAIDMFDVLVTKAPDYAEVWNKRATLHYLMGRHDASLSDIERTLALEPRHFGALSGRALVLTAKGDKKGALIAIEQALRVNPFLSGAKAIIERNGGSYEAREPI